MTRKEEILDKAMALLAEEGLNHLTMKRVAERVGFSEPAMYRHFKDKQDLMLAMIQKVRDRFFQIMDQADRSAPPGAFLEQTFCRILAYLEEVRGVTILFLSDSTYNRREPLRRALLEWFGGMESRFSAYLEEAKARGEVPERLHMKGAALTFLGAIQSLTIRYIIGDGKPSITEHCKDVLQVLLKGVTG